MIESDCVSSTCQLLGHSPLHIVTLLTMCLNDYQNLAFDILYSQELKAEVGEGEGFSN
jgi:hypothetical protein